MSGVIHINGRPMYVPEGHVVIIGDGPAHTALISGPPEVQQTPNGRLKVGMRVRLSRAGWECIRPHSEEEARAALEGSTVVAIVGPMTDGPDPVYSIELDGPLGKYLVSSDDVVPAV